jgi:hypothetical protein
MGTGTGTGTGTVTRKKEWTAGDLVTKCATQEQSAHM